MKHSYLKYIFAIFLIILLTSQLPAEIQENLSDYQKELESIQQNLEKQRKNLRKTHRKEQNILTQVQSLKKELNISKRLSANINHQKINIGLQVIELEEHSQRAKAILIEREELLAKRLVLLYKQGTFYEWKLLFSAKSFVDFLRYYAYWRYILEQDHKQIERIKMEKALIVEWEKTLHIQKVHLEELEIKQKIEEANLIEKQTEYNKLLANIQNERSIYEKTVKELKASAQKLENLIYQLIAKSTSSQTPTISPDSTSTATNETTSTKPIISIGSTNFAKLKGKMIWPIKGKIISTFGKHKHPKFKTYTFNKGLDIQAPKGTSIKSVGNGIVVYADLFQGYGKLLIINNGDGFYTLYAHCDKLLVKKGDKIQLAQSIATVGNTGSIKGNYLHFEIRHQDKPLDPLKWLKR